MDASKRVLTGLLGWAILLLGMVMIIYPGPGWLAIFAGLALLAREFVWARKTLDFAHGRYTAWQAWHDKQPFYIKFLFWLLSFLTATITIWLLNGYGLINEWLNLGFDWVRSPLLD